MTNEELSRARVARGAAWLDSIAPGWEDRIDLLQLDLASCTLCVCGQVFREVAEVEGHINGFTYAQHTCDPSSVDDPFSLTDMGFMDRSETVFWVELILARRAAFEEAVKDLFSAPVAV